MLVPCAVVFFVTPRYFDGGGSSDFDAVGAFWKSATTPCTAISAPLTMSEVFSAAESPMPMPGSRKADAIINQTRMIPTNFPPPDRQSVRTGQSRSVRVVHGGRRAIKQKNAWNKG